MDPKIGLKRIKLDEFNKEFTGVILNFIPMGQIPKYKENKFIIKKLLKNIKETKIYNFIILIISFITLILILLNKSLISKTIIYSFDIWFNTLVPSMFPMFILSDILITYNFTEYIPKCLINFISKHFNISKNAVLIIFLSMISGFPSNAISIVNAYDKNLISKHEAEHLLLFNHFANPLFVLETIGVFYLNNNKHGIIILISHILSNIIIGLLFRNKNKLSKDNYISNNNKSQSIGNVISISVKKAINNLLMISGTITLFLVLSTLIINVFNLNIYLSIFIQSILEMTTSIASLSMLNISNIFKVIISTMIISFGGLSIHLQVYSALDGKLKYINYFIGRIYQTLISGIIALILIILI